MKKFAFLVVLGIGFLIGSKAGTGPYETVEQKLRSLKERPDVQHAVDQAKSVADEKMSEAVDKVNEKMPSPTYA